MTKPNPQPNVEKNLAPKQRYVSGLSLRNDGLMFNPMYGDIICILHRDADADAEEFVHVEYRINIKQEHRHHSPSGMSWGYAGSGPADLALNILALYIPVTRMGHLLGTAVGRDHATRCWDGTFVHDLAFKYHQDFKKRFIADMPRIGGVIPGFQIEHYIIHEIGIAWNRDIWLPAPLRSTANHQAQVAAEEG